MTASTILGEDIRKLSMRGILSRELIDNGYGYACHPILRDYFRAAVLRMGPPATRQAANLLIGQRFEDDTERQRQSDTERYLPNLLVGQPSTERPRSVKQIEPVLLAIGLLTDGGQFTEAHELHQERLENGTYS